MDDDEIMGDTPGDDKPGIPVTFPVVIVEGMETSDGRYIEPGALEPRAMPLPILSMTRNPEGGDGHAGAEVIGRIDVLTRHNGPDVINRQTGQPFPEGVFVWSASGEIDPDATSAGLIRKRYLTGNSADLSGTEAEMVWGPEDENGMADLEQIRLTKGFISGTTVCPFPAFAEAYIILDGEEITPADDMPQELVASAFPSWRSADVGDDCLPCEAGVITASAADAGEPVPPREYFEDLGLDGPTPLTIGDADENGFREVFGHIATWETCHIGFQGQCRTAPRSRTQYAYFHTGALDVADVRGEVSTIPVGRLTYDSGHAELSASANAAAAHYDNTATLGAFVVAGEDDHGIWVHGVLAPGADVQKLKATPPSGDWRPVRGGLELVAVLHVNTPGFPVPRSLVAAGGVQALVAAGVLHDKPKETTSVRNQRKLADEVAEAVLAKIDARKELADRHAAALAKLDEMAAQELEARKVAALELLA
jgi:hypothetical protein